MRAILTYHSIDLAETPISVTPECFVRHAGWLASGAVKVLSLPELLAAPDTDDAVAITFDDALGSVFDIAAPVLASHGLTATLFVPTAHVGRDNAWRQTGDPGIPLQRIMTWDEIGVLAARGWTIGAHTRTHPRLVDCDASMLADELTGAAEDLRVHLGTRPDTFAYPYGAINPAVCQAAGQVYGASCTTELRILEGAPDRAALPRLDAYYFREPGRLESWGTSAQRRYIGFRRALRRVRQALRG